MEDLHLDVCIFYNSEQWIEILEGVISPTLLQCTSRGYCRGYRVSFSYERGPHLRLVLESPRDAFNMLATELHKQVNDYMQQRPSKPIEEVTSDSFFMDFPVNSVHFNVFKETVGMDQVVEQLLKDFHVEFSAWIINMDRDVRRISLDDRFAFTMQQFLVWSMVSPGTALDFFEAMLNFHTGVLAASDAEEQVLEMEQSFQTYREDLLTFVQETTAAIEQGNTWLHGFAPIVTRAYEKIASLENEGYIGYDVSAVAYMLKKSCDYMGVSNFLLVLYFLKRTFETARHV